MFASSERDVFSRSFEKAPSACAVVAIVSAVTGLLFSNSLCDMDLTEWHIVNAILCGSLAAAAHFAQNINPKAMEAGFRVYKAEIPIRDLLADGLVSAASSLALVACPILLVLWSLHGFASMGVGICAEAAPLFFAISLCVMLAEAAALIYIIGLNLKAAGYDLEKAKHHAQQAALRAKDAAVDLTRNGHVYLMRASETVIPTVQRLVGWGIESAQRLWANRPRWLHASHWAGSEGSYLLR